MPDISAGLALLTGTSTGIGEALAWTLLDRGWQVIGLARRRPAIKADRYDHINADLADPERLDAMLGERIGPILARGSHSRVGLVNNAADPALLGTLDRADAAGFLRALAVNVVAPQRLMGWVLRNSGRVPLRICNVSSGAAIEPLPGLGCYGASKAALRMVGMIFAVEQEGAQAAGEQKRDVTVWSYEPGIVDTPMQTAVRTADPATVPMVGWFQQYAAAGKLRTPDVPATEIADYLESSGKPAFSETRFEVD